MFNPVSTYRIQFHGGFKFSDLSAIIPYLSRLGIKTIYASPIFEAVPGSMHGYDGVNPNRINPEIGSLEELRALSVQLKQAGMSWMQDIVPNHMAFHHQNQWLMDVLKCGEASTYRRHFDILSDNLEQEPLMVPFLGASLDEVINNDELELLETPEGRFLKYYDNYWPVNAGSGAMASLKEIAESQYYRLCSHQETDETINYRRFFTVNGLICLNMQHIQVFNDCHTLVKALVDEDIFQGLRIDHIDGLSSPEDYLQRLRMLVGEETYILVEKILEPGEALPERWPVQGTTGYDYLGLVNQLFTNQKAERKFNRLYKDINRYNSSVPAEIRRKKLAFLSQYMNGELDHLCTLLLPSLPPADKSQISVYSQLIAEVMARYPVYRLYGGGYPLPREDEETLVAIFKALKSEFPGSMKFQKRLKEIILSGNIRFYLRLMQFTGPLMAKGVEDTLMYTYTRFIGNNEVGDSPEVFGISPQDFCESMAERQQAWPLAMNASATHDTKRGEDARARLAVLTDLRDGWIECVQQWRELNTEHKTGGAPDPNDEYFIYQTLVATYAEDPSGLYKRRILEYIEKALRESKRRSAWDSPDLEYEEATIKFISALLEPTGDFWPLFSSFLKKIAALGSIVSLSALILKFASPGVVDVYQGTELWDFSMVDPDNRRPVDYKYRNEVLMGVEKGEADLQQLWETRENGHIKLFLMQGMLNLRQQNPELFTSGLFLQLEVTGKYAKHVFAFARRYQQEWVVVAIPLNMVPVVDGDETLVGKADWADTRVQLPVSSPEDYQDIFRNTTISAKDGSISLTAAFTDVPVAVLHAKPKDMGRSAGVLLHISSLPSNYGIGDFGPGAFQFLDFLSESGQRYWQVLPMNPQIADQAYSPYSSDSVMAGNNLLISPDLLCEEGLLSRKDLTAHKPGNKQQVSYETARQLKDELLAKAWQNYQTNHSPQQEVLFTRFCQEQAYWLDDYASFVVLKRLEGGKPWFQWNKKYRNREKAALLKMRKRYWSELAEVQWQQFVFSQQWELLRKKAEALGISFIGDLPFYTGLDSADVWANRELFKIKPDGTQIAVAGVPPDYFNEDGQLWGMPVYNWSAMKRHHYKWWSKRIARNLEFFELIRLDHFRAFASYWEIPATADTARAGSWQPGPGADFFKTLRKNWEKLPFIAEDLGEISSDVYQLRDDFEMPGMKVLQFAFGEDAATSIHSPHNFNSSDCIVYTGTHDNNTTRGWYDQDTNAQDRKRIEDYLGHGLSSRKISWELIKLAYGSVARIAIIPFQDLLAKGAAARMNTPATVDDNWVWRISATELSEPLQSRLRKLLRTYGRADT